jgi:PBP1b-binding outer membrane lipoprotein LpoB
MMNTKNRLVTVLSLLTLALLLSSCSKPQDLDTPCPDYGKQCSQALINT